MIGIVGGVGPYAGLDLLRKVYDNTVAGKDQDHLDVVMISVPAAIPDRTAYLLGWKETREWPSPKF
jgi:aspartate racemase